MVNTKLLKWARERAGLSVEEASKKVESKKYVAWEEGEVQPTLKQLEKIAQKFSVPYGYLFLSKIPEEKLPIQDFRTIENKKLKKPSIELLETIYDAQRKQNWLREEKIKDNEGKVLPNKKHTDKEIITEIKKLLDIKELRKESKTQEEFLSGLITKLDEEDFLIIRNGVLGNNTHRPLDRKEFQGFALFDEYAPAIFINGKDYRSSQIFTIVHELVHLFLNESALDGNYSLQTEQKCNQLAAEVLLPGTELQDVFDSLSIEEIANNFKISVFVVLIKAKQGGLINDDEFKEKWESYRIGIEEQAKKKGGGGDFYLNIRFRAGGESFLSRVMSSTLAGETLYRDAYSLTGLKADTFNKYYRQRDFPV